MQGNQVAAGRLEIGDLVNVGLAAGLDSAAGVFTRPRRPNVAGRQQLEINISHDSVQYADHAIAFVMIVNGAALAALPAHAQDFYMGGAVNQVADIMMIVKKTISDDILHGHLDSRRQSYEFVARNA